MFAIQSSASETLALFAMGHTFLKVLLTLLNAKVNHPGHFAVEKLATNAFFAVEK